MSRLWYLSTATAKLLYRTVHDSSGQRNGINARRTFWPTPRFITNPQYAVVAQANNQTLDPCRVEILLFCQRSPLHRRAPIDPCFSRRASVSRYRMARYIGELYSGHFRSNNRTKTLATYPPTCRSLVSGACSETQEACASSTTDCPAGNEEAATRTQAQAAGCAGLASRSRRRSSLGCDYSANRLDTGDDPHHL